MAKSQINTKSRDYQRDKEAFLRELKQFNESKNIPYKVPYVNGIDVDLYLFYSLVQQRGGLSKVNHTDAWDTFLRPLRLPHPCINGSTLLRKIYSTYLEKFERAKGPPGRDDDMDLDDDPRGRRGGFPRVSYSGAYITASGEQLRTGSRAIAGPSERLALSLLSPMPNEQDFAVNVCTVLAADYSNRLPLNATPHILDFLLAHAGVYNHASLRDTIGRSYREARGRYPDEFWKLRAGGGGPMELIDENKFTAPGLEQPELMVQALAAHNNLTDRLTLQDDDYQDVVDKIVEQEELLEDWMTDPTDEDQLFAPPLPGGAACVYTQRVLQVASIARSLSFHEENLPLLAANNTLIRSAHTGGSNIQDEAEKQGDAELGGGTARVVTQRILLARNHAFIRFLLLCSNCWVGTLRQSGLDTLGNVCAELVIKDPATCLLSRHILSTVQACLVSEDRARVLAALEMLNKLSQNEANDDVLLRALDPKIYSDVCSLLTLRDIMALVSCLECVYSLTSLGERACEQVASSTGTLVALLTVECVYSLTSLGERACEQVASSTGTLVALLTVEAQSYGPQACILMRVVETVSGAADTAPAQDKAHAAQQQQPSTPVKQTASVDNKPPPAASPAPVSGIQQAHLQQKTVQENEQFAVAWLRASYEPLPPTDNSTTDAAEIYRQYAACCSNMQRKGVIAPQHFPRLVRDSDSDNSTTDAAEIYRQYAACCSNMQRKGVIAPQYFPRLVRDLPPVRGVLLQHAAQGGDSAAALPPACAVSDSDNSTTDAAEIYRQYAACCSNMQRKGVIAPQHFPRLVRTVFGGTVGPNNVTIATGETQQMYVGIRSRNQTRVNQPAGPSSPILKAQLTNKVTGAVEVKPTTSQPQQTPQPSGHILEGSSNTSLIKHLLAHKVSPAPQVMQVAQRQQNQQRAAPSAANTVIVQQGQAGMDVDPEALIKCTTIIPGGVTSTVNPEEQIAPKEEPVQIQIDEQAQLTIKSAQNKMLADLLEKKSNPPVQVVQMGASQINAPTIQITETGQIVQVKQENNPVIQYNAESGQIVTQTGPYLQIKNEQGQVIQLKNDQGQIIQLKSDQLSGVQIKNEHGQIVQLKTDGMHGVVQSVTKNEPEQNTEATDHSFTGPPAKRQKVETKREVRTSNSPQESVSKTAANLYAALAASALEDEEDLVQQPSLQVQQPTLQVQQPTLQVQQPTVMQQVQQVQQQSIQVQQPMLQVQPMDVQNILASQSGQLILQDKSMQQQQPQFVQQPMQIIATPSSSQGGMTYLTQNIPGNMMQKTIIIVQGATGGGPITLTNSGVLQSGQRVIVSQAGLAPGTQSIHMIKAIQTAPQLTPSQQPIITAPPQPHKAQLVNQNQQIVVTQKQPPALISTSASGNQQIIQGNQQLIQGNQQLIQGNQQLIQGNQQLIQGNQIMQANQQQIIRGSQQLLQGSQQIIAVSNNQQIIMNAPIKAEVHRLIQSQRSHLVPTDAKAAKPMNTTETATVVKTSTGPQLIRQVITRQPVMMGGQKIGERELVTTEP
ncbi:hypothetical protein JYU34_010469, partial [Plutella xylostella]